MLTRRDGFSGGGTTPGIAAILGLIQNAIGSSSRRRVCMGKPSLQRKGEEAATSAGKRSRQGERTPAANSELDDVRRITKSCPPAMHTLNGTACPSMPGERHPSCSPFLGTCEAGTRSLARAPPRGPTRGESAPTAHPAAFARIPSSGRRRRVAHHARCSQLARLGSRPRGLATAGRRRPGRARVDRLARQRAARGTWRPAAAGAARCVDGVHAPGLAGSPAQRAGARARAAPHRRCDLPRLPSRVAAVLPPGQPRVRRAHAARGRADAHGERRGVSWRAVGPRAGGPCSTRRARGAATRPAHGRGRGAVDSGGDDDS